MLILTDHARDIGNVDLAAFPSLGPVVYVTTPANADLGKSAPGSDDYTFEFLEQPSSVLVTARQIALKLQAHAGALPPGPIIAMSERPTRDLLTEIAFSAAEDEQVIASRHIPGAGTVIMIGAAIVANPLLLTFFAAMEASLGEDHTDAALNILRQHTV